MYLYEGPERQNKASECQTALLDSCEGLPLPSSYALGNTHSSSVIIRFRQITRAQSSQQRLSS